jgi:putative transposase
MALFQRRLPHLYVIGQPLFVTFRLHGSLPANRAFPNHLPAGKAFVYMDRLLDEERSGLSHMRMPAVAEAVIASIRKGVGADYDLHTWVVMPNHVHLLITPNIEPSAALRRLKGASARQANQLLRLTGQPFWQTESYDHLVRNQAEFERIESYIIQNPVRAGLVRTEEEYPWSSAFGPIGLKPDAS